jgi:CD68 antigen
VRVGAFCFAAPEKRQKRTPPIPYVCDSSARPAPGQPLRLSPTVTPPALQRPRCQPSSCDFKLQTSNLEPRTSNLEPRTSNHKPQTTNHKPQTTNHKPQTTNHKPQTTNHKPQTTNVERRTWQPVVGSQMTEVGRSTPYFVHPPAECTTHTCKLLPGPVQRRTRRLRALRS